jgi:hypothetical protein
MCPQTKSLGCSVPWKMRPLVDASLLRCVPWTSRPWPMCPDSGPHRGIHVLVVTSQCLRYVSDAGLMCPRPMCPRPKVLGCCTPWTKCPLDIMSLTDVSRPPYAKPPNRFSPLGYMGSNTDPLAPFTLVPSHYGGQFWILFKMDRVSSKPTVLTCILRLNPRHSTCEQKNEYHLKEVKSVHSRIHTVWLPEITSYIFYHENFEIWKLIVADFFYN